MDASTPPPLSASVCPCCTGVYETIFHFYYDNYSLQPIFIISGITEFLNIIKFLNTRFPKMQEYINTKVRELFNLIFNMGIIKYGRVVHILCNI